MPRLVIENGPDKGRYVVVSDKGTVIIGRDSSTGLQLHDTMASRMHFKIETREDGYWILDLDSMNGTLLNGKPLQESRLAYGDLVKVGETLFSFVSEEGPAGELTGQKIAGYRILERIGRGGMGTVYKAEQVDLQRIVALKVLSEEHGAEKEFIELFVHEARAAARLNHPNIVQVYDVKRQSHLYFFSMEYVPGGSVQEILAKDKKLPVPRAVRMMLDVARGIEYAHSKGIVHRDIKPDNLMIAEDGKVKLGDLGLARRVDEKIGPVEERSVIGTPHYIAPEQVLGRGADFRSDIYSLGATFYRMLAGSTPFAAPSIRDLVNKKVREDPIPLQQAHPEIPRSVSDLVQKMMSRDPAHRHQTASEVVADLERIHRELVGNLPEGTSTVPMAVSNRKLLLVAVGLLVVLVLGSVIAAIAIKRGPTAPTPGVPPGAPDDLAERMLQNAKAYEFNQMDRNDAESIRRAIQEYKTILDRHPAGSDPRLLRVLGEAREARTRLEGMLRECLAAKALAESCEAVDVSNWLGLKLAFDRGQYKEGLARLDETVKAYHDFAQREEFRKTEAADKARKREDYILKWKVEMERWQGEYGRLIAEVESLEERKKYREAWRLLSDFAAKAAEARLPCEFAKDRYDSILFMEEAEARRKKLVSRAEADYYTVESEAKKVLNDREKSTERYDAILKKLDEIIQGSVEDLATSATLLRRNLEEDFARWRKEEADRSEKVRRERLRIERESFEKACWDARDHVRGFRFKEALAVFKSIQGRATGEEYGPRLGRRIDEMQRAIAFLEAIVTAFKKGDFEKAYSRGETEGTITEFTEAGFWLRVPQGGSRHIDYSALQPKEFYQFIKSSWKKEMDPHAVVGFAVILMEFGLYEEANRGLEGISKTVESDAVLKAFCARYLRLLADGEYTDSEEIEAIKRFARLKSFIQQGNIKAIKDEVDLLRRRYGRTSTFQKSQSVIDEALKTIAGEGTDEDKSKLKSERWKLLEDKVAAEKNESIRRQADIVVRLQRIRDNDQRNLQLGEMYAAHGKWVDSTSRWLEAQAGLAKLLRPREGNAGVLKALGLLYVGLLRNSVVGNNPTLEKRVREEAAGRFKDGKAHEWWNARLEEFEKWQKHRFPGAGARLQAYLREMRENPDDPERIWRVAETYSIDLQNLSEARGYYLFLLENHPDFEQVKSGECLYRLAEILYQFKEIPEALTRYNELIESYPHHPAVKGGEEGRAVAGRREECYRLFKWMGYEK